MEQKDYIEIVWHIDDVMDVDESLTEDDARSVLHYLAKNHDANIGINWEVIEAQIHFLKHEGII